MSRVFSIQLGHFTMLLLCHLLLYLSGQALGRNIFLAVDEPLLLSPLIENGELKKARELSRVDPAYFANIQSYSGFITVNKTAQSHLFFWFFPAEQKSLETTPWIIWLQGGPGASSLFGLFEEIGPLRVVNGSVEKMPITWGSNYSLLFIDNPVGSGFSFSDKDEYVTNEDQGLAIGNGWIDPLTLLQYSKFGSQVGLLDPEQAAIIYAKEESARQYYKDGKMADYAEAARSAFNLLMSFSGVGLYNYIQNGNDIENEYGQFLNNEKIRKALHVGQVEFDNLNGHVYSHLSEDMFRSVKTWLEELIENYGVMCYSGQLDVIVAYALSVNTYRNLKWSGAKNYKSANREKIYNVDHSHLASYLKSYGNFMDVMIRAAGHMVPKDQPVAAKQMIDMFINKFQ